MRSKNLLSALAALSLTLFASASALAGDAAPPVPLDAWGRYTNVVDLDYKSTPAGWAWVPKGRFYFMVDGVEPDDVALAQFASNGKDLGPLVKCPLSEPMPLEGRVAVVAAECQLDLESLALTGPATIDVTLGYRRTASGKNHPDLARYRFAVASHKDASGKTELHVERDERLGEAWVHLRSDGSSVELFLWFKEGDSEATKAASGKMRCSVGGKAMPMSDMSHDRWSTDWRDYSTVKGGAALRYSYSVFFSDGFGQQFLRDNPGEYRCSYTRAGELERELTFTVDASGKPVKPACQKGPNPLVKTPAATTIVKSSWHAPQDVAFDRKAFAKLGLLGRAGVPAACGFE